jgi:hypothetical protein
MAWLPTNHGGIRLYRGGPMSLSIRPTVGTGALALATGAAFRLVTYREVETGTLLAGTAGVAIVAAIIAPTTGPARSLAQPLCHMTCAIAGYLGGRLVEPSSEWR